MQKRCAKCDTKKEVSEFYKNRAAYDGLTTYCKECESVRGKTPEQRNTPSKLKKWADSTLRRLHLDESDY
jgi:hypothetical protein